MCDLNRVVTLLDLAKGAYIVMIGLAAASASACLGLLSAAAAPGLMAGAVAAALAVTGFFTAALVDIGSCNGPCDSSLNSVRAWLVEEIAMMGTIAAGLGALVFVVCIPIAGGIAAGAAMYPLLIGCGVLGTVEAMLSFKLVDAFNNFNNCQASQGQPHTSGTGLLFGLTIASVVLGLALSVVGGLVVAPAIAAVVVLGVAYGWDIEITDSGASGTPPTITMLQMPVEQKTRRIRVSIAGPLTSRNCSRGDAAR